MPKVSTVCAYYLVALPCHLFCSFPYGKPTLSYVYALAGLPRQPHQFPFETLPYFRHCNESQTQTSKGALPSPVFGAQLCSNKLLEAVYLPRESFSSPCVMVWRRAKLRLEGIQKPAPAHAGAESIVQGISSPRRAALVNEIRRWAPKADVGKSIEQIRATHVSLPSLQASAPSTVLRGEPVSPRYTNGEFHCFGACRDL